jgi:hypothetical protein
MSWSNNFNKYLHNDIDNSLILDFDKCDKILQLAFRKILMGVIDPIDIKPVFDKVKNTAFFKMLEINKTSIDSILDESFNLGVSKNNDYGSENILKFGIIGIVVRLGDKIARYKNLSTNKAEQKVKDESLKDTLMDIINYATYGEMLSSDAWD